MHLPWERGGRRSDHIGEMEEEGGVRRGEGIRACELEKRKKRLTGEEYVTKNVRGSQTPDT
jgi:hypothetical protein